MSLLRRLTVPATEPQMGITLCLAAVVMSLLLWGLIWQSDVIDYQREVIRWLWSTRARG